MAAQEKPVVRVRARSNKIGSENQSAAFGMSGRAAHDASSPFNRYLNNWWPSLLSADMTNVPEAANVRARARDAVRQDPYMKNIVRIAKNSIIGGNFILRLMPDHKVLNIDYKVAYEWGRMVTRKWKLYAESPNNNHSDARGVQTFSSLMQTAYATRLVDGEVLGIVRTKTRPHTKTRTCLRLVDTDRLENPDTVIDETRFRNGVELDGDGAPIRYHFRRHHPSEANTAANERTSVRRENERGRRLVVHSYDNGQIDLNRGISDLVSSLVPGRMLSEYSRVFLEKMIGQAIFAASIKSELDYPKAMEVIGADAIYKMSEDAAESGIDPVTQLNLSYLNSMGRFWRERNLNLQGAQVNHLAPNEELVLHRSDENASGYAEYEAAQLRRITAGAGASMHNASQNYNEVSYASGRLASADQWRMYKTERENFANEFAMPFFVSWLEEEIMTGRIPLPAGVTDFYANRDALSRGKFISWGRPIIDPTKERKGQEMQLNNRLATRRMLLEEEGIELEDVIDGLAHEEFLFAEQNVELPPIAPPTGSAIGDTDGNETDPDAPDSRRGEENAE